MVMSLHTKSSILLNPTSKVSSTKVQNLSKSTAGIVFFGATIFATCRASEIVGGQ